MKKKFVKFITTTPILKPLRPSIWKLLTLIVFVRRRKEALYIYYKPKWEDEMFALYDRVKKETGMELTPISAIKIYKIVKQLEKIPGDIAEVGVYRGGSACIIKEVSKKPLHLFDTFTGLPTLDKKDDSSRFTKKQFDTDFQEVKKNLSKYSEVYFYKGLFPDTAGPVKDKKFSFVHLDVDLYQSTLDSLKFFYPRMNKGGIIISHDYTYSKGVRSAFDEFLSGKPEIAVDMSVYDQGLVVKI